MPKLPFLSSVCGGQCNLSHKLSVPSIDQCGCSPPWVSRKSVYPCCLWTSIIIYLQAGIGSKVVSSNQCHSGCTVEPKYVTFPSWLPLLTLHVGSKTSYLKKIRWYLKAKKTQKTIQQQKSCIIGNGTSPQKDWNIISGVTWKWDVLHTIAKYVLSTLQCYLICDHSQL